MMLHGVSMLQREAYRLGWRENGPKPLRADADPLGPKAALTDLTDQPLNFGLVRKFGRAMQLDLPDAPLIDVDDPVVVAHLMVFVASDILQQEMKRRRREAGVVGPRDDEA
jgi:hypothetical protein